MKTQHQQSIPSQSKRLQSRQDGYNAIRVYHKKSNNKTSPRYLLKCGCCEKKLEIYYDDEDLEIIEVQLGELLIEDDIIRYEDMYGRV